MRVAIFGSRTYPRLEDVVNIVRRLPVDCEVVSGGALGVDIAAETAAYVRCSIHPKIFLPDPKRYDNRRYFDRNQEIVDYTLADPNGEHCWIAFKDPRNCKGTDITLGLAVRATISGVELRPDGSAWTSIFSDAVSFGDDLAIKVATAHEKWRKSRR